MARLTDPIRRSILQRVIQDIPSIDYRKQAEEIAQKDIFGQIPHLEELVKKHPCMFVRKPLKAYKDHYLYDPATRIDIVHPGNMTLRGQAQEKVKALLLKANEQEENWRAANNEIARALKSVTTTKRLAEAYPDLAKYIPDMEKGSKGQLTVPSALPALHAAGWDGKKANKE